MIDPNLNRAYKLLEVEPACTLTELRSAYTRRSRQLAKKGSQVELRRLQSAFALLTALLDATDVGETPNGFTAQPENTDWGEAGEEAKENRRVDLFQVTGFKSPLTNAIALPCLTGIAIWAINSPPAFLLAGFQTWVHEFGHATVAWMTGRRALPLPIGWTSVSEERTHFVYFGVPAATFLPSSELLPSSTHSPCGGKSSREQNPFPGAL